MKTVTKKITVKKEVYIADDGSEFDDIDECEAYEMRQTGKSLKMYSYSRVPCELVENCWYVKLDTQDEILSFINLCKFDGVSHRGVNEPGVYMYTEGGYGNGNNAWTNISEIVEHIESEVMK